MNVCPQVSICLPCLNTASYLVDCLESIHRQNGVAYELIVCDGYSVDGSWEMLQDFCASHAHCNCFQSDVGLYEAWNQCIRLATGSYVYIATSDDLLDADALQSMVAVLEDNPDCGICQIQLAYIDRSGQLLPESEQWEHGRLTRYHPHICSRINKRSAPHDGVLMAGFHTVYESINQLLIRANVFREIGVFDSSFGAVGDFEWGMRAGLTQNCIYLPQPRAYWRQHPGQATQPAFTASERLQALVMTRTAYRRASANNRPSLPPAMLHAMEDFIYDDYIAAILSERSGLRRALSVYAAEFCARPLLAIRRLIRVVYRATTTTFDYSRKQSRMVSLMRRFRVPAPRFL